MSNLVSSVPRTIPRIEISTLTPESFAEDYLIPGLPVILTGALEPEGDWHLSFLTEQLGDRAFKPQSKAETSGVKATVLDISSSHLARRLGFTSVGSKESDPPRTSWTP